MTPDQPLLDVTDMVAVHNVFRDTFGAASTLVGAVAPTDTERIDLVANFYSNILSFLRGHHEGEDELVFPLLRARCPEKLELIDRIAGQHADAHERIGASQRALDLWSGGSAEAQAQSALSLEALGTHLTEHLVDEEGDVLPLCAEHLSLEEWGTLPGHGMASFDGDKIWLILGLIRQRMTQGQRDQMLAVMPPPAIEMWNGFGEQAFASLIAEVGAPLE